MKSFLIAALTADGFIARRADHLADWSSQDDKRLFVRLTKAAGVVVMGATTFATIGRALPGRRTIVYTRHPQKIAVQGVETTTEPPQELMQRLRAEGANGVAICGGAQIYRLFMQAGLIDELYLTISPLLFGRGVPLFDQDLDVKLHLLQHEMLNDQEPMLHYQVVR